ncbi:hypothetical protein STCU_02624 [Strigomonas culicis]|uniref:Uncharacterized protein n=1 Tax=Strigomonas culicis TaxID=28005 RepID=S9UVL5_9TRYP|nr:hypothetical protein STCU_03469 [Strigomonas culicis]EPY32824.1 hypothetical protein STCU_02624 [Strigomonas culicis]|eukprot:EPY31411.1 hypothetical protein STCU_03469 [Strigomonas culicis]
MSFRIEKKAHSSSFMTPGESYMIYASSASLRKHLSDSYWCEAMQQVCDGKLSGVAVRYTGENLVFMQFRPHTLSPAGYRYPLFMSIPVEFLVPCDQNAAKNYNNSPNLYGSFSSSVNSDDSKPSSPLTGKATLPKLCVVCGRYNMPTMIMRPHGWKCKECKGKKSDPALRLKVTELQVSLSEKDK